MWFMDATKQIRLVSISSYENKCSYFERLLIPFNWIGFSFLLHLQNPLKIQAATVSNDNAMIITDFCLFVFP